MIESAANEPAIEIVGGDSENQTWFGGKCSLYIDLDPPSAIKNDVLPYNYHNYTTFSNFFKVFGCFSGTSRYSSWSFFQQLITSTMHGTKIQKYGRPPGQWSQHFPARSPEV